MRYWKYRYISIAGDIRALYQRQGAPIAPRCLKRKAKETFSFVPDCLKQYEIQPAPKKRAVKTKVTCGYFKSYM